MFDIWASLQNGRRAPSHLHRRRRTAMRMHDKPLHIRSTSPCSIRGGKHSRRNIAAVVKTVDSRQVHALLGTLVVVFFMVNVGIFKAHTSALHEYEEGTNGRKLAASSETYSSSQLPQLVWLMSFPNSGTSYTSQLIREATLTDSASNYADETPAGQGGYAFPVYDDQPEGPFWIRPESTTHVYAEPSKYILTKTHCGMRCNVCPPEKYTESSYSFRRRCLTTKWLEVQGDGSLERTFSEYTPDRLAKAIHLIRDPFDNIVSRFLLENEIPGREAHNFARTRQGFRKYCKSIDNLFAQNEQKMVFLQDDILKLIRKVPCHEDFIRYIEWHNLAFNTADDFQLPTYVLHYEEYGSRFDAIVRELLQFLELEQKAEPLAFRPSNIYDYFTSDERAALKEAFHMMASFKTWRHLSRYFEGDNFEYITQQ